jgi:hypothetical protein
MFQQQGDKHLEEKPSGSDPFDPGVEDEATLEAAAKSYVRSHNVGADEESPGDTLDGDDMKDAEVEESEILSKKGMTLEDWEADHFPSSE